jgi:peptide-methionine (S)-S-oxide reductase
MRLNLVWVLVLFLSGAAACQTKTQPNNTDTSEKEKKVVFTTAEQKKNNKKMSDSTQQYDTATLGAGCFWCIEAIFQDLKGVQSVKSGYTGGKIKNPTYKEVCSGLTGHAEVAQIVYDPSVVSFDEILEVFWQTHDPTTLNRQGADVGTQYRSAVFYHNDEQKKLAEDYKQKLNDAKVFDSPIVTEISPLAEFYVAEDYHQNYYNENGEQGYCRMVIRPKVEKFKKVFKDKLKEGKTAQ